MNNCISNKHLEFIVVEHFVLGTKPGELYSKLTDPDAYAKYDIQPIVKLSKNYFYKYLSARIPEDTINTIRAAWSNNLLQVPIASKRYRLQVLQEALQLARLQNDLISIAKLTKRAQDEVGEDAWRDAVKESGKTSVSLSLGDKLLQKWTSVPRPSTDKPESESSTQIPKDK